MVSTLSLGKFATCLHHKEWYNFFSENRNSFFPSFNSDKPLDLRLRRQQQLLKSTKLPSRRPKCFRSINQTNLIYTNIINLNGYLNKT